MKRAWDIEDLIEHWTLPADDLALLKRKTGHACRGLALLLKAFQYEGRFPQHKNDIPGAVVSHVAALVVCQRSFVAVSWQRTGRLRSPGAQRLEVDRRLVLGELDLLVNPPLAEVASAPATSSLGPK